MDLSTYSPREVTLKVLRRATLKDGISVRVLQEADDRNPYAIIITDSGQLRTATEWMLHRCVV